MAPVFPRGKGSWGSPVIDETAAVAVAEPYSPMPGRIIGVDLARALAILGMFAAHVGPEPEVGGVVGAAMYVSHGRASILFATLAGLSLALVTGGARTSGGEVLPSGARRRIAVRAGIIFAIGAGITVWGTPVEVILAYYGVLFLVALPFLRFRPSTNFVLAAVLAVLTPVALLMLLGGSGVAGVFKAIERFDPIALAGGEGLIELLFTGSYPVLTWTPFVIAGVALGRLDWQRSRVRIVVAGAGTAVAVLAYGIAWVLGKTVDDAGVWFDEPVRPTVNYWAGLQWASLFTAEEHTGAPFEIIGGVGVAMVVLAGCIWFAARFRRVVAPLVAMGSMSLTLYVGHVLAIDALDMFASGSGEMDDSLTPDQSLLTLSEFIGVAAAVAWIWKRFWRRGPLEAGIHRVTALVK